MKKRPIIICLLVAILGSVIFWLQSNYIITGWLNGEAFYQGRPTSYWRRELGDVDNVCINGKMFLRSSFAGPKWLSPIIKDESYSEVIFDHPLWKGNLAAKGVLTELMIGSSEGVRRFAEEGLVWIANKD
jgi:hypothetical protein